MGVTQPANTLNFSWNRYTNALDVAGDEELTDAVYFRAYLKGATGPTGAGESNNFIDNFTVNGTVSPVPEPAACRRSRGPGWRCCAADAGKAAPAARFVFARADDPSAQ